MPSLVGSEMCIRDSPHTTRVGDLDLPERRKRYTSSRGEEGKHVQVCPCGKAVESSTHMVGEREMYKAERDVLRDEERGRM